jgi:hypothetical protein
MKKIVSISVLLITLTFLSAPALVFADQIPNCCKTKNTIIMTGVADVKDCGGTYDPLEQECTYAKDKYVGSDPTCNLSNLAPDYSTKEWGLICLLSSITTIADWIFTFAMAVVIIFVVMGAFLVVTSAGDAQKVTRGRNYILYAAIGMIVSILAKAVPTLVRNILG